MVTIGWTDCSNRVLQLRNAIAYRQAARRFGALIAHDLSKMRAHFDNDFRLIAALAVVPSENLTVAQDRMARDRLADRFSLELPSSLSNCSRLILFRSRRHGSRGFLNWSID